jgi:hypothetical protein
MAEAAQLSVATLTKQMQCKCENYEVKMGIRDITWVWSGKPISEQERSFSPHFSKHCLDCDKTTAYATEEEALVDKESLLQKQIKGLQGELKQLRKK